jgi:DNA-binding transcriptional MerR regulator/methylmalonyl-CoA mutase cobalamin-binding subunit
MRSAFVKYLSGFRRKSRKFTGRKKLDERVESLDMDALLPISAVAKATGLSVHTLRVWERRYGAVEPTRTTTNRRLYTQEDVRRLRLLKEAVERGHSIQIIARLTESELEELTQTRLPSSSTDEAREIVNACLEAVWGLQRERLAATLERAATILGVQSFVLNVVAPLIREIGEQWHRGEISIAQEHMASAEVRHRLFAIGSHIASRNGARRLLITTPKGHVHELGAAMMMVVAARRGWAVTYLGPDLPAKEIAEAYRIGHADAIALSLVFPEADENVRNELRSLRSLVGDLVPILVGGQAAHSYQDVLYEINAIVVGSLDEAEQALQSLETRPRRKP